MLRELTKAALGKPRSFCMPTMLDFQNLRQHWQRMKDKYWLDWDDKLYKDPEKQYKSEKMEKSMENGEANGTITKDEERKEEEKEDGEEEETKE